MDSEALDGSLRKSLPTGEWSDQILPTIPGRKRKSIIKSLSPDQSGTGNQWTPVPSRYKPGPWSWNAYQITVTEAASFTAKFKVSEGNPAGAEFRSILVHFRPDSGERTYTSLIPGEDTQVLEARVMA